MKEKLLAIELTTRLITMDKDGNMVMGEPMTIHIPMPDKHGPWRSPSEPPKGWTKKIEPRKKIALKRRSKP